MTNNMQVGPRHLREICSWTLNTGPVDTEICRGTLKVPQDVTRSAFRVFPNYRAAAHIILCIEPLPEAEGCKNSKHLQKSPAVTDLTGSSFGITVVHKTSSKELRCTGLFSACLMLSLQQPCEVGLPERDSLAQVIRRLTGSPILAQFPLPMLRCQCGVLHSAGEFCRLELRGHFCPCSGENSSHSNRFAKLPTPCVGGSHRSHPPFLGLILASLFPWLPGTGFPSSSARLSHWQDGTRLPTSAAIFFAVAMC